MAKVGIYSGSFNPVHKAHVALCDWLVAQGIVDEVWMIRTPHNPLKAVSGLMPDADRQSMLNLAIQGHKGLRTCTIEDTLPQPNYTIYTLRALARENPEHEFHFIIGADNWLIFDKWRDYDAILRDFHVIVYPRPGYPLDSLEASGTLETTETFKTSVRFVDAPIYDISSTAIREALASADVVRASTMLDTKVYEFLLSLFHIDR